MRLVVMQPSYLPWVGYFDLFLQADLFLVYDNVQFDKNGWRNRNRIKTHQGVRWLTVPVLTSGMNKPSNREIKISNVEPWRRKHLKSISLAYQKAPYYDRIYPLVEKILSRSWDFLIDVNMEFIRRICEFLGIQTPIQFASELKLEWPDDKNDRLIAICKYFGADEFYEAEGGRGYIESDRFEKAGIRLTFQSFLHPVYPQLYGPFVSHLSVIDLLFNCGEGSIDFLRKPLAKSRHS